MKTDWSSLWKKEDWWAVWIGLLIALFAVPRWLPGLPQVGKWLEPGQSFPAGAATIIAVVLLFIITTGLTLLALSLMGKSVRQAAPGLLVTLALAFVAVWVGKYARFSGWGLETVLWALLLGLIVSNARGLPEWLRAGVQTEFFVKIGLVLLGAEMLFSVILKAGGISMLQALLVVVVVWFFAYYVGRRFGMSQTFSSTMASALSICGVSAAIAASGAVKANPRHTSYIISLVLLIAMPMLVGMPFLAKAIGLSPTAAGAWLGSTIDTTGAVVAAGSLVDPIAGLQSAALVKMAQNVLIGFAAFLLALWSSLSLERKLGMEKPGALQIWHRFPKFILGFLIASALFSFVIEPRMGAQATGEILGLTKGYREWFFTLAFLGIGLDTRFKELFSLGRGKPAAAFVIAQLFNIGWALLIVWLLWSGRFFPSPI